MTSDEILWLTQGYGYAAFKRLSQPGLPVAAVDPHQLEGGGGGVKSDEILQLIRAVNRGKLGRIYDLIAAVDRTTPHLDRRQSGYYTLRSFRWRLARIEWEEDA